MFYQHRCVTPLYRISVCGFFIYSFFTAENMSLQRFRRGFNWHSALSPFALALCGYFHRGEHELAEVSQRCFFPLR